MPQQHPGRLQILVVDAHCKRRLFSTKTPTDPDELARRFCTPDNCLVVVLRDNRFLFRLERAPGSHCRWHRAAAPAISIYRTGYLKVKTTANHLKLTPIYWIKMVSLWK